MKGQRFKLLKKYFKDISLTTKKMFYFSKSRKISLIFKGYLKGESYPIKTKKQILNG